MVTLFWDIDGTLLTTAGAGMTAWRQAAQQLWGRAADLAGVVTAGFTDGQLATTIARSLDGAAVPERVSALIARYESLLASQLPQSAGHVLPNVREVLEHLHGRDDVANLLLTGNTRTGASTKLAYYELAGYFEGGGFSDGAADRAEVAGRAVTFAESRLGGRFDRERAYVIGDTPHDIHCARAIGVRAFAVASHVYTATQLATHGPWAVAERLPEPDAFVERLGLARVAAARTGQ